jgi:hypothetical protein
MADHFADFPFDEIRDKSGDYFSSPQAAMAAGFDADQIWSVIECDGTWSYGPVGHVVNLIGYVATAERHDGETYYHEEPEDDEDEDGDTGE